MTKRIVQLMIISFLFTLALLIFGKSSRCAAWTSNDRAEFYHAMEHTKPGDIVCVK